MIRLLRQYSTTSDAQRCIDEAYELRDAVATQDRALILDELVDVLFFLTSIGKRYSITRDTVREYASIKAECRINGIRDKVEEISRARQVVRGIREGL